MFVELLRETWERSFEEKVLNGAVTRYEPAVHTQQLAKSAVDGEIVRRIEAGMTETSQWVHDQPRGGHGTVPSPMEFQEGSRPPRRVPGVPRQGHGHAHPGGVSGPRRDAGSTGRGSPFRSGRRAWCPGVR